MSLHFALSSSGPLIHVKPQENTSTRNDRPAAISCLLRRPRSSRDRPFRPGIQENSGWPQSLTPCSLPHGPSRYAAPPPDQGGGAVLAVLRACFEDEVEGGRGGAAETGEPGAGDE